VKIEERALRLLPPAQNLKFSYKKVLPESINLILLVVEYDYEK
jgi:hypothetical protein